MNIGENAEKQHNGMKNISPMSLLDLLINIGMAVKNAGMSSSRQFCSSLCWRAAGGGMVLTFCRTTVWLSVGTV